jgi:hypothetical protein
MPFRAGAASFTIINIAPEKTDPVESLGTHDILGGLVFSSLPQFWTAAQLVDAVQAELAFQGILERELANTLNVEVHSYLAPEGETPWLMTGCDPEIALVVFVGAPEAPRLYRDLYVLSKGSLARAQFWAPEASETIRFHLLFPGESPQRDHKILVPCGFLPWSDAYLQVGLRGTWKSPECLSRIRSAFNIPHDHAVEIWRDTELEGYRLPESLTLPVSSAWGLRKGLKLRFRRYALSDSVCVSVVNLHKPDTDFEFSFINATSESEALSVIRKS